MSRAIVLYMHVHQPFRIRNYSIFDIANSHNYFSEGDKVESDNDAILHKVAEKSYIPTNEVLFELLQNHPEFRVSLSITGTFIEQCEKYAPHVLRSFQRLVATGKVDIVAETYYHSLAFFYDRSECVLVSYSSAFLSAFLSRRCILVVLSCPNELTILSGNCF